jgi:hypothetical protein
MSRIATRHHGPASERTTVNTHPLSRTRVVVLAMRWILGVISISVGEA